MKFLTGNHVAILFVAVIFVLSLSIDKGWEWFSPFTTLLILLVLILLNYLGIFATLIKQIRKILKSKGESS